METTAKHKVIPLDYIRGLLVAQGGRCAITGMPLDPQEVNADHILPLSREDMSPTKTEENIWLVHKRVNAMKGTMTYDEFVRMCRMVLDYHSEAQALLGRIQSKQITPVSKETFDNWVKAMCDADGRIRSEPSARPYGSPAAGSPSGQP